MAGVSGALDPRSRFHQLLAGFDCCAGDAVAGSSPVAIAVESKQRFGEGVPQLVNRS